MSLTALEREELRSEIADVLATKIEPLFKSGYRLTLVARDPNRPDGTVIVSSDDTASVLVPELLGATS